MAESILKLNLIGVDEANNKLEALTKTIIDQKQKQKELREEIAALSKRRKEKNDLTEKEEARLRSLTIQQEKNNKELRETRKEYKQYTRVAESQGRSLNALRASLNALQTEYAKIDQSTEAGRKSAAKMQEQISELDQEVKGLEKSIGDSRRNVGNYGEAFENVGGPIGEATSKVKGIFDSVKKLIATPAGAITAVFAGFAIALKELVQFNDEIDKTNAKIAGITNQTGEVVDAVRIQAESISEVLGVQFDAVVSNAKVIVEQFGLSYQEALDQIQTGLLATNGTNEEFLDSIKEYSTFFSEAGYSVEEFSGIVNAGYDLGMYTDKLPDAIKEFDLSIRSQSEATREALSKAFGEAFTEELLAKVRVGAITSKDALALVSAQAVEMGLDIQEAQQITEDVFRGAGEDAGGVVKIFEAVNEGVNGSANSLDEFGEKQQREIERTEQLKKQLDEAFKDERIVSFTEGLKQLGTTIKIGLVEGMGAFVSLVRGAVELTGMLGRGLVSGFKSLFNISGSVKPEIKEVETAVDKALDNIREEAKEATADLENAFKLGDAQLEAIRSSFTDAFAGLKELAAQAGKDGGGAYGDNFKEQVDEALEDTLVMLTKQTEAQLNVLTQLQSQQSESNQKLIDEFDELVEAKYYAAYNEVADMGGDLSQAAAMGEAAIFGLVTHATRRGRSFRKANIISRPGLELTVRDFTTEIKALEEKLEYDQLYAQEYALLIQGMADENEDGSGKNIKSANNERDRRREALQQIIDAEFERTATEKVLLAERLREKLKELKLDGDITKLKGAELNARLALEQAYNDALKELDQDEVDKQEKELRDLIASLNVENKIKLNSLQEELNEKLKAIEDGANVEIQTEEDKEKAKEAIREEYRRLEIAQQQAHLNELLGQYENLLAQDEIQEGLNLDLLSDEEALRVKEQISNLKTQLSALGLELAELGTDKETGEKVGAVAASLGLTKSGEVKMQLALDAINQSFAVIDEAISVRAQRRLGELEAQKEAGVITAAEFEEQRRRVEYEAALAGHRTQIVNAINQSAMAALNAYASTTAIPVVGPALAPAAAAIAGAFGAAQVGLIAANKPRFSQGGVLDGPSHANGGIQMFGSGGYFGEAEGGEAILTKGVMQNPALASMASAINVAAGGRPLFQDGGVIKPMQPTTASDNISNLLNTVTERQPVLVVETLNQRQQSVQVTESLRTI